MAMPFISGSATTDVITSGFIPRTHKTNTKQSGIATTDIKMKKYDNYKDSGIEWIGEIPEHWEVKPLKYILKKGKEGIKIGPFGSALKLDFMKPSGYKIYGQENVIKSDFLIGDKYIGSEKFEELKNYEIFEGDLVITMMGTTGRAMVVPRNIEVGIMDSHLTRVRADESKFIPRLMEVLINDSYLIASQVSFQSKGAIMGGLNSSIIKSFIIPVPSIDEQVLITNYLDHKTTQIDTLISKKQQFITLLQEERLAVINQAVTKGLDPKVKMKDSGIEWLGKIPEHWEVKKLKYCLKIQSGKGITNEELNPDGGFAVYGGNGVMGYTDKYSSEGIDLIIGRVGALCGNVHLIVGRKWISDNALFARTDENEYFMEYFLRFLDLNRLANKNAQPLITGTMVKDQFICLPIIGEQLNIVNYVRNQHLIIDALLSKAQQEIELLKEYKTALISEVVTGKVDVRKEKLMKND
jgi:type I restriction enzyme S subunit